MPSHPGFDPSPRVAADAPYPPLEVNGPNHQIVRMLAFDLASDKSEMTSVTQYMYQGWALDRAFAGIARTLERLAKVEMRHMQILGKLIRMLGGDPRYAALRRGRPVYWNGGMVSYSRSPKPMLLDSFHLEEAAIETYRRQIAVVPDEGVSITLKRIVLDEEVHVRLFEQYLRQL